MNTDPDDSHDIAKADEVIAQAVATLPVGDFSKVFFQKPSVDIDGGLYYDLAYDPLPDGSTHYVQLALDYATTGEVNGVSALGSYLAFYDNKIDQDFVKFGVVGPWAGSVAFGCDGIIPGIQVSIHDFPWIHRSLDLYSQHDGICLNGRSMASDRLTIQRDDNTVAAWQCWHQGSGIFDWRLGMEPKAGSYDLVLCNSYFTHNSSASKPGDVVLRITPDGTLVNKTIAALEQRISNLEAKIRSIEK